MRDLFLLVGVPACGKSTFIKENRLERHTLSADTLRPMFSQGEDSFEENGRYKPYGYDVTVNKWVWHTLYDMLESRMIKGQTVFMDNTHLFKHAFSVYDKLRQKYNYNVYIIDCMDRVLEDGENYRLDVVARLIERDSHRPDPVGETDIMKYLTRYENYVEGSSKFPDWIKDVIPSKKFFDWESDVYDKRYYRNLNEFDRVKIIGDIHGDYTNLQEVFKDHKKGTAYIFVGDYLDRGKAEDIKNTLEFLSSLKGRNIFFLRGNHEKHWFQFVDSGTTKGQFAYTVQKLLDGGYYTLEELQGKIKELNKRLLPYVHFIFQGKHYFVSHAGVDRRMVNRAVLKPLRLSEKVYVMGAGENPYDVDIDTMWADSMGNPIIVNVHGHRNNFERDIITKGKDNSMSINLTQDGHFRWIELDKEHDDIQTFERSSQSQSWVDDLMEDDDIREVYLEDGIVSHNFTKEVFDNNRWTPNTLKARGLFTRGNQIIGRGFDKFFNIGQNEMASLDNLTYPVQIHEKYNGFLGIVFWDDKLQKIQFMSKSGGKKYSNLAREVIMKTGEFDNIVSYFYKPQNRDTTLLYEIIDPVNDPHIIKYDKPAAKRLAIVLNTRNPLAEPVKGTFLTIVNSRRELDKYLESIKDSTREGVVLYDSKCFMLKYKTPFYLKAKELRGALGNKRKKRQWYYGAEDWYDYCLAHGITEFTPQLALDLWEMDKNKK